MTELSIERVDESPQMRMVVRGELDIATAPQLESELTAPLPEPIETVVLDLRELAFMDSSGLRAVLVGQRRLQDAAVRMVVAAGNGQVARVLELAGLEGRLEIAAEPPSAERA